MGEIGANLLFPKALKSYPKYNKSPNLVTLVAADKGIFFKLILRMSFKSCNFISLVIVGVLLSDKLSLL